MLKSQKKCFSLVCNFTSYTKISLFRPIVIIVSVFSAVIGILILVIVVGYCYTKHCRQGNGKAIVSPEIQITATGNAANLNLLFVHDSQYF